MRHITGAVAPLVAAAAIAALASCSNDDPPAATTTKPTTRAADPDAGYTKLPDQMQASLKAGRWAVTPADKPGAPLAVFDVQEKFEGGGPWLLTEGGDIGYWTVDRVYPDPCGTAESTQVGPTVRNLATALVAQRPTTTTKPVPVSIDGHDGLYLELTATDDMFNGGCTPDHGLYIWDTHVHGLRGISGPAVDRYWILNVFGQRVVLLTSVNPGADKETVEQLSGMVEATTFLDAEHGLVESGSVVDSIGGDDDYGETPPSKLAPLAVADVTPYPVWQAFDQDSGRFLFTGNEGPGSFFDSTTMVRVLAPGLDAPVATIRCDVQCHWPAFGPGPDELTALVEQSGWPPRTAQVYGFDGSLRDEIDMSGVWEDGGIVDIAWSPDGSRLAVSTFTGAQSGAREPDCLGAECAGRVWILDRAGSDPVLLHREDVPGQTDRFPPLLMDLAWAPDGEHLGLISAAWLPEEADPPRLVVVAVESGQAETIHEFDDCVAACSYGFAWSPDGSRIAVTDGAEIAQLSSDGKTTFSPLGSGNGPLAWLDQPPQ